MDRVLNVLAVLFSLIAIFFSWQANQINLRQVTSQIIVLDADHFSGEAKTGETGESEISCLGKIRLTNLGGASTSIVEIKPTINFHGESIDVQSTGGINYSMPFIPGYKNIKKLDLSFFSEAAVDKNRPMFEYQNPDKDYLLDLPAEINAFSTVDIFNNINLKVDQSMNPLTPFIRGFYSEMENKDFPLFATFTFRFATGKEVTTPGILCVYLHEGEP